MSIRPRLFLQIKGRAMSAASAVVVAAARRSERRIVTALRAAGALSAEHAAALQTAHNLQGRILARLVRSGCIIQTENNLYWLYEAAYAQHRDRRRGRILLVMFGIATLSLVAAAATIARADPQPPKPPAPGGQQALAPPPPTGSTPPASTPSRPPSSRPRPPDPPGPGETPLPRSRRRPPARARRSNQQSLRSGSLSALPPTPQPCFST